MSDFPKLKRAKGIRRVEKDGEAWVARTTDGREYPEEGFRWNTRSGAWHAAYESDWLIRQNPTRLSEGQAS